MRLRKEQMGDGQLKPSDGVSYLYRVFATNEPGGPHPVIDDYDQLADAETLIGEPQREGLLAIPSQRFDIPQPFFRIAMLASNLWRWTKLPASHAEHQNQALPEAMPIRTPDLTLRISRLALLYVTARNRLHGSRDEVLYSMHEQRAAGLMAFPGYLDHRRNAA